MRRGEEGTASVPLRCGGGVVREGGRQGGGAGPGREAPGEKGKPRRTGGSSGA